MSDLSVITRFLDEILLPQRFDDVALNGLQVESRNTPVSRIAVAVDAGLSIIERAVAERAQLLIVHHGLFWGSALPITGALARKLELLFSGACSLYASHLPLDAHPEVGNGAELARYLELESIDGFCEYHGSLIGAKGRFASPQTIEAVSEKLSRLPGARTPLILPFGISRVQSVGIVTGSGAFGVPAAAQAGLDLYVSGEPKHEVYHLSKELKINCIFAGHYATETFGVRALARRLEEKFQISTVFLDETSGI